MQPTFQKQRQGSRKKNILKVFHFLVKFFFYAFNFSQKLLNVIEKNIFYRTIKRRKKNTHLFFIAIIGILQIFFTWLIPPKNKNNFFFIFFLQKISTLQNSFAFNNFKKFHHPPSKFRKTLSFSLYPN